MRGASSPSSACISPPTNANALQLPMVSRASRTCSLSGPDAYRSRATSSTGNDHHGPEEARTHESHNRTDRPTSHPGLQEPRRRNTRAPLDRHHRHRNRSTSSRHQNRGEPARRPHRVPEGTPQDTSPDTRSPLLPPPHDPLTPTQPTHPTTNTVLSP